MHPDQRQVVVLEHLTLAFTDATRRVEAGWIDQEFSPLGRRRHCQAVKRRMAEQAGSERFDAVIIGRRHLLTVDALVEEYFASRVQSAGGIEALRDAPVANENGRAS